MKTVRAAILSLFLATVLIAGGSPVCAASGTTGKRKALKTDDFRFPVFHKQTMSDPHSRDLSPDAVQLADNIGLAEKLARLDQLEEQAKRFDKPPVELRQDMTDLRVEIIALIEQTRLEIDFVVAEIDEEQSLHQEVLTWYTNERDERVNKANLWAFRTNGILWAASESLAIPSYKQPKLSIPSGTLGIIAGLVPSVFSIVAVRSAGGKHHGRKSYPNMLCKIYDLPTTPRTEYPDSVWKHLNSPPSGDSTKTRRELLIDHWMHNKNIQILKDGVTPYKIERITGVEQGDMSIELLTDRTSMLREVKACVLQMTRPLMELSMCLRNQKQLAAK